MNGIVVFEATIYVNKYGRWQLERHWCVKETPKMLLIDMLLLVRAMACDGAHYDSHHSVAEKNSL